MSSLLSSVHVRYVSAGLAEIWIAAMTSSVDSAPYLVQRAEEISLGRRVSDALKAKGVTTLAQLAFCVGQPGQVLVQAEFETWSESLLTGMTVGEKASLRRLILEAQTMLVASLKDMAAPSEGASPKKVGVAERNARMDQLRAQLAGVSLTGQLEPSHALLDMAVQQWETRCLKYILEGSRRLLSTCPGYWTCIGGCATYIT